MARTKSNVALVDQIREANDETEQETPAAAEQSSVVDQIMNSADAVFQLFEGIPVPTTKRERQSKYPWDSLSVGASFFVPGAKLDSFSTLVSTRNKKSDAKFICRKYTGPNGVLGVMVWRKS